MLITFLGSSISYYEIINCWFANRATLRGIVSIEGLARIAAVNATWGSAIMRPAIILQPLFIQHISSFRQAQVCHSGNTFVYWYPVTCRLSAPGGPCPVPHLLAETLLWSVKYYAIFSFRQSFLAQDSHDSLTNKRINLWGWVHFWILVECSSTLSQA